MRFAENKHLISFSFFCLVVFGLFSYNFAEAEVLFAWDQFCPPVTSYECMPIPFKQGVAPNEIDGAFYADTATADKVCQLKGYSRSTRTDNSFYSSPADNFCVRWDVNSKSWIQTVTGSCSWYIQNLYCANDTCPSNAFKRCVGDYIYWFNFCGVQEGIPFPTCYPNGCQTGPQNGICGTQCVVVPPAVDLKINGSDSPGPIPKNTSAILSWTSIHNPASCIASGAWSDSIGTSGEKSTGNLPSGTYTYNINCTNTAGSGSDSVTLIVLPDLPTVNLQVAYFSEGPYFDGPLDNLPYNTPAFLKWSATDAVSCTASDGSTGWPGSRTAPGSWTTGNLTVSTIFRIYCTNTAGNSPPDSVTVNVNQKPTVIVDPPVPNACAKSYPSGIDEGNISITWTYTDADEDSQDKYKIHLESTDDSVSKECEFSQNVLSGNKGSGVIITKMINPDLSYDCSGNVSRRIEVPYNKTYTWSVSVKDGTDWSDWADGITLDNTYVPIQPYPYAGFTYISPVKINQDTLFTDISRCYNGSTMILCKDIPDVVTYLWNFNEENLQKCGLGQLQYCSTSIIEGDTTHVYSTISPLSSPYPAVLTINDGKSCSKTAYISVGIAFKPPVWFETASF